MTSREFLEDPRGKKKHCAFCKYFTPRPNYGGIGSCSVPSELVVVPTSYRADNEGTSAYYGNDCTFFRRKYVRLPDWDFLSEKTPLGYSPEDFEVKA